jgi:hypothetical protein
MSQGQDLEPRGQGLKATEIWPQGQARGLHHGPNRAICAQVICIFVLFQEHDLELDLEAEGQQILWSPFSGR